MSPNHFLTLSYFNTGPEGYILSSPEAEGSRAHLLFLGLSIVISEVSGKSFWQGCDEWPFLLSKTIIKGTCHRGPVGHGLGGSQLAVTRRLFIITKVGSGVQWGAMLFCFQVFLARWGQNCRAKGEPWKSTSQVCHRWLSHSLLMTSRWYFPVTVEEMEAAVLLQTLPTVLTGERDSTLPLRWWPMEDGVWRLLCRWSWAAVQPRAWYLHLVGFLIWGTYPGQGPLQCREKKHFSSLKPTRPDSLSQNLTKLRTLGKYGRPEQAAYLISTFYFIEFLLSCILFPSIFFLGLIYSFLASSENWKLKLLIFSLF